MFPTVGVGNNLTNLVLRSDLRAKSVATLCGYFLLTFDLHSRHKVVGPT